MRLPSRLRVALDRARTSYFAIPALGVVGGVVLAILTLWIDHIGLPFEVPLAVEKMSDARSLINTIASTSISVAATVFSITIVVLSLASSQFGPRLLRNFLKNRSSQFVLAHFVGTHAYCLVALRTVGTGWDIPQLTCLIALLAALAGASALIYFIHHTAQWVQADRVIGVVADALDDELERMTGDKPGYHDAERCRPEAEPNSVVLARRSGYVQALDDERLLLLAERHDLVIERRVVAGEYVFKGRPVAALWGDCDDEVIGSIQATFGQDDTRSDLQDPFHLVDQLVELALRALSPGINDPITAVRVLDRLGSAFLPFLAASPRPLMDPEGEQARVLATAPDVAALIDRAFGEIRRAGSHQHLVVRRLAHVLPVLAEVTEDVAVGRALQRERDALPAVHPLGLAKPS